MICEICSIRIVKFKYNVKIQIRAIIMNEVIEAIRNKKWMLVFILLFITFVSFANDALSLYQNLTAHKTEKKSVPSDSNISQKKESNISFQLNSHTVPMKPEEALSRLKTNISLEYALSMFGIPIVKNTFENNKFTEYVYSFKNFYLQMVSDDNNIIIFYAVTIKNEKFKPLIPYINAKIGSITFDKATDGVKYKILYNNLSSKYYEYGESFYLGFPSNYKKIYIAYNPAGVDFTKNTTSMNINDLENQEKIQYMRLHTLPNTYAIGSGLAEEESIINNDNLHIGIDYFTAINLFNPKSGVR